MNLIFIVSFNKKIYQEIYLDFTKDKIVYKENEYTFQIINKNEIIIYWEESVKSIFYTNDGYLYFFNAEGLKYICRIFIFEKNVCNTYILNFKDKSMYSPDTNIYYNFNYVLIEDTIEDKIHYKFHLYNCDSEWISYDGKVFYNIEQYTLLISRMNKNIYSINHLNDISIASSIHSIPPPSYVFIHACIIDYDDSILQEQLSIVLNKDFKQIYIGIVGISNTDSFLEKYNHKNIIILYAESNIYYYEIKTINKIQSFCSNLDKNVNILYIHTKGVRKVGNKDTIYSWRKMMEYFLIENMDNCISYLDYYDTLGCNFINASHYIKDKVSVNGKDCCHYSGNFWWSKSSYLKNLPLLEYDLSENSIFTRCRAENWVLSGNCKIGVIYQDNKNTHPYHRYVFEEDYKNISFIVLEMFKNESYI